MKYIVGKRTNEIFEREENLGEALLASFLLLGAVAVIGYLMALIQN